MMVEIEGAIAAYNVIWAGANVYNFSALLRRGKPSSSSSDELENFAGSGSNMPKISILLPAYHEANIIKESATALCQSDYPKDRFEILILLEHGDVETIEATAKLALDYKNVRPIIVSSRRYKSKPNALNHGLSLSTGDIVGVIDAEDVVEKTLLLNVAYNIAGKGYDVVQGVLDMANDYDGWKNLMQRAEYSYWFRHLLPSMEKSGLPIPLGGTTNFFRTDLLKKVGGWNPENLTEDFELGIRLYNLNQSEILKQKKQREQEKVKALYPSISPYTAEFYAKHAADYGDGSVGAAAEPRKAGLLRGEKITSAVLVKMISSVTKEESTTTWSAWMRQRVRWQQGKVETAMEYTVNMPETTKGKANTMATVLTPHIAVLNVSGIALGAYALVTGALSTPVLAFTYLNLAFASGYCIANGLSYASLVKHENVPHYRLKAAVVAITTPAYWVVQWAADMKALKREYVNKDRTWEKTKHNGRHIKHVPDKPR